MAREPVLRAASFLLLAGPITGQERWEELQGISPSTLAALITAMICAAEMAESAEHKEEQAFVEMYADWLESEMEGWTVTRSGAIVAGTPEHYVRISPVEPGQTPPKSVDDVHVQLKNLPPGEPDTFPAKDIVDAGFLELVRYGIRAADEPLIVSSMKVVDELLRVETPSGVLWRRYNRDGYGQQADGSSYVSFGRGRGWPLLVGERGHYELAAGRSADDCIRSMEGLATPTHLLPEQSWDAEATPDGSQRLGRPTGSAVPLLWAHAEYIKLLRSKRDGVVFDRNERVALRYQVRDRGKPNGQFWSFACPIASVPEKTFLRIMAAADFELVYTTNAWEDVQRSESRRTRLRVAFADVPLAKEAGCELSFTFRWLADNKWEGRNFTVRIV